MKMKARCCGEAPGHAGPHGMSWKYAHHHRMHCMPVLVGTSLLVMAVGTVISLWMLERMTRALESLAMVDALDELGEQLSEVERAQIASRIRVNLEK